MSWLERDSAVQYAPERVTSPLVRQYQSARGAQPTRELDAVEWFDWWLHASRSVIDFWQMTVRQQQDAIVRTWREELSTPITKPGAQTLTPGS